jgi:hypothetical protein
MYILSSLFSSFGFFCQAQQRVLVCYGKFDVNLVKGYDLIILESAHFNFYEVKKLKENNKKLIAYISLGEIHETSANFQLLKKTTLGKNNNWNSHYLDLSSAVTLDVLNKSIKNIFFKGYDGLFLDNIDNFGTFGPQLAQQKQVIDFIASIKKNYPQAFIIQNAGLELLDQTDLYINSVLIESVASNYSFETGLYGLRDSNDFLKYTNKIKDLYIKHKIPIILTEYADSRSLYLKIEKRIKNLGYSYFIGEINLQEVPSFF